MRLLIVRHAIAEERDDFARSGQDDSLRPLTRDGRRKMRRNARGLALLVEPPDTIVTSPFTRAVETAAILSAAYGQVDTERSDALLPTAPPAEFNDWLQANGESRLVCAVGHEPHLGRLVASLVTAQLQPWIVLKKGGACLLEFSGAPGAGAARLLWALAPGHLRAIGA